MNDTVLNKINHFLEQAKKNHATSEHKTAQTLKGNDSLSKAIRNSKEAAIFLNELNTIVKGATPK